MAHILVGLDMKEGLVDSMVIQRGSEEIYQYLYYEGIPYKCGR